MRCAVLLMLCACKAHEAPSQAVAADEPIEPRPFPAKPTAQPFTGTAAPAATVITAAGWTVRTSDATLVASAPNDPRPRLLVADLAHPTPLIAGGSWACLTTLPGAQRIVHCVDPVRRLHITSQPLPAAVTLAGIEPSRLVLHGPTGDLALPLP